MLGFIYICIKMYILMVREIIMKYFSLFRLINKINKKIKLKVSSMDEDMKKLSCIAGMDELIGLVFRKQFGMSMHILEMRTSGPNNFTTRYLFWETLKRIQIHLRGIHCIICWWEKKLKITKVLIYEECLNKLWYINSSVNKEWKWYIATPYKDLHDEGLRWVLE